MIRLNFDIKYFLWFTITFMIFTVIGTVSHEYGHIIVAKSLGYKTTLHYGSMGSSISKEYKLLSEYHKKNKKSILSKNPSKEKTIFKSRLKELERKKFWITLGGPFQTMLTGMLGLLILYFRKEKTTFSFIDWLAVFLSLFWLREVFNLATGIIDGLFLNGTFFGGDEYGISKYLDLPIGTVSIILGVFGFVISLFVVFIKIPKKHQLTFIISGFVGGLSGFYLWYHIFGPKLLPLY